MNLALQQRAYIALSHCLHLKPTEQLLVVEDSTLAPELVMACSSAGVAIGAETSVMTYTARQHVSMLEFGIFARASLVDVDALPSTVAAAMKAADAVVMLSSDLTILFDPTFRALLSTRTRVAWMPYLDVDSFLRLLPRSAGQAAELVRVTRYFGSLMDHARLAHVTSANGTDLRMSIANYATGCSTGTHAEGRDRGGIEVWPAGQVTKVPDAGSAKGTLVIDRSLNAPAFKEVFQPVTLTVSRGYVTDIQGGSDAMELRRFLEAQARLDGGEAYHLTELALGTNSECRLTGISGPLEDTHRAGCISLALGADVHLGGDTRAGCHVDMTMRAATLEVDGHVLVRDGVLSATGTDGSAMRPGEGRREAR